MVKWCTHSVARSKPVIIDAAVALMREDVVFRSPVVFKPYHGREAVRRLLEAVLAVFEDFRYVREIGADGAHDHALVFETRVGDKQIEGCDFIQLDEDGAISAFDGHGAPDVGHARARRGDEGAAHQRIAAATGQTT